MIIITQTTANDVVVTVTENKTLSAPYWLFRFVNMTSKEEFVCIAANTSSYTYRYDEFTITEVAGTPLPLQGQIHLKDFGLHNYYIYEQTSSTNLDYTLATGLCEEGKMLFLTPAAQPTNYTGNDSTTGTVYKG